MAKTQKQPTFEQQFNELEALISSMDQGEMPLDESIEAYKRGVELIRALNERLEGARAELKVLDMDSAKAAETAKQD